MNAIVRGAWAHEMILRLLRWVGIDRAVFYGIMGWIWPVVAGPVSAILIATYFSPEIQGYHYTFASLIALQVFIELGLGVVVLPFASHEWSKLTIGQEGKITGDTESLSHLRSISRLVTLWFGIGADLR